MEPLDKYRYVVGRKSLNQLLALARLDDIGFAGYGAYSSSITLVIMDLATIILQNILLRTTILEGMQMYIDSKAVECPDAMEHINHTPIVGRKGDVE